MSVVTVDVRYVWPCRHERAVRGMARTRDVVLRAVRRGAVVLGGGDTYELVYSRERGCPRCGR